VAALIASHGIEFFREQVNDFAFAFIAPLRSKDNQITHDSSGIHPNLTIVAQRSQIA
jgi:hypothetical protein